MYALEMPPKNGIKDLLGDSFSSMISFPGGDNVGRPKHWDVRWHFHHDCDLGGGRIYQWYKLCYDDNEDDGHLSPGAQFPRTDDDGGGGGGNGGEDDNDHCVK